MQQKYHNIVKNKYGRRKAVKLTKLFQFEKKVKVTMVSMDRKRKSKKNLDVV